MSYMSRYQTAISRIPEEHNLNYAIYEVTEKKSLCRECGY